MGCPKEGGLSPPAEDWGVFSEIFYLSPGVRLSVCDNEPGVVILGSNDRFETTNPLQPLVNLKSFKLTPERLTRAIVNCSIEHKRAFRVTEEFFRARSYSPGPGQDWISFGHRYRFDLCVTGENGRPPGAICESVRSLPWLGSNQYLLWASDFAGRLDWHPDGCACLMFSIPYLITVGE